MPSSLSGIGTRKRIVCDCILGFADGITVPFALAAGLSSLRGTHIVIFSGLAELVSDAILIGLGGYLFVKPDADHYATESEREAREVELYIPKKRREKNIELFEPYRLDRASMEPMMIRFRQSTEKFIDFMMRSELNLALPDLNRIWISAFTIGGSYLIEGLIPLIPYMCINDATYALYVSCLVTSVTLFCFGYLKSIYLRPKQALIGAIQTLDIGAVVAAFSDRIVTFFNIHYF
ncbi:DUF125-domain-containing protein [Backusella circina FSU 941]|nr:DUF125-domain-containing protein [Backusella circina FSU 941]